MPAEPCRQTEATAEILGRDMMEHSDRHSDRHGEGHDRARVGEHDTVDATADEPERVPPRRSRLWTVAVPFIALLAGLVFTASANTAQGTDLRGGSRTELTDLIAEEQRRQLEFRSQYQELRAEVNALSRRAGERDARVRAARRTATRMSRPAQVTPVRGPGIRVTLDDAPRRSGQDLPGDPRPNDLVVHEQDVQAVVNALWAGGAEAMQIMDQRVVSTTAVRCVGNTLILHGVVYSPPFTVTAVGDPERMRAALNASREIAIYRQYVDAYGLGYSVRAFDEVTLPGYSGAAELEYATVPRL